MGRPPKLPSEADKRLVLTYVRALWTIEQICEVLGVADKTFAKWMDNDPEFLRIVKHGREETFAKIEGNLYQRAIDGDNTAAIFALKTQRGHRFREQPLELQAEVKITPAEELLKRVRSQEIIDVEPIETNGGNGNGGIATTPLLTKMAMLQPLQDQAGGNGQSDSVQTET